MVITIKMPTGKFMLDENKVKILDGDKNPVPILEDKEFTAPFIPARKLKNTIIVGESMIKDVNNSNNFESMASYITDIYGMQFTSDNVLDGLGSVDLITEFTNCITAVTGDLNLKVNKLAETDPNVKRGRAKK